MSFRHWSQAALMLGDPPEPSIPAKLYYRCEIVHSPAGNRAILWQRRGLAPASYAIVGELTPAQYHDHLALLRRAVGIPTYTANPLQPNTHIIGTGTPAWLDLLAISQKEG